MDFEAQILCNISDESCSDESDHMALEELYGIPKQETEVNNAALSNSKKKRNGQERERLPTRRPDPNVYNRNALLARENRRKKKQHLETLEINLQECKRVNTALLAALKRQRKVTRRLEREKQYYKNIVTNRTDIKTLVAALNGRLYEKNPQLSNFSLNQAAFSPTSDSFYSRGSYSSHSSSYEPEYQSFDNYSDNEFECPSIELKDNFDELLHTEDIGLNKNAIERPTSEAESDILSNIIKDHSYVNNEADETLKNITGICLHVQGGKISLEFCPSCHWNANQSPPEQLLQEDGVA